MQNTKFLKRSALIAAVAMSGVHHSSAFSQPIEKPSYSVLANDPQVTSVSGIEQFRPQKNSDKRRIDYQILDEILQNIVVDFGPSSRLRANRPANGIGSRIVTGHTSQYRLEGSRIVFGYLNDDYLTGLTQYREDLVDIANSIDITRLSKDEQLAFWMNLHNVLLIEKIALEYPENKPSTLTYEIGGVKSDLDHTKFINIRGHDLSLFDIRENIVYSYWSDPIVIYGFFRGDIGSPRMARFAFTADNIEFHLNGNAYEFVNSLRGFYKYKSEHRVSKIYDEAKSYFFPNWQNDIAAHIRKYADADTASDIVETLPFEIDRYETMIADLSGGRRRASGIFTDGAGNIPAETIRLLSEVQDKREYLQREGKYQGFNRGFVTIEDIETDLEQEDQSPKIK